MDTLSIALDWTPNTNHTGFFVAQYEGFYKAHGLDVEIISPAEDDYATTPTKKLEKGEVDFSIGPTESVISYNTKSDPFPVKAVAAILEKDASAIACLASSGITTPADLDGKTYASYDARYEDEIVMEMIRNDGGKGEIEITTPNMLGIWNTLIEGEADATWVFVPWEGVEAEQKDLDLNYFRMEDYGIPYGYSPVIIASEPAISEHHDQYAAFMQATRRGFQFAIENPKSAAEILKPHVPEEAEVDLLKSQRQINEYYGDSSRWGEMDLFKWSSFLNWLKAQNLIPEELSAEELFTNVLLRS